MDSINELIGDIKDTLNEISKTAATKDDLLRVATKDDLLRVATKDDLREVQNAIADLRGVLDNIRGLQISSETIKIHGYKIDHHRDKCGKIITPMNQD